MQTGFICPDGESILISECIAQNGCRLGKRCLTRATLMELGKVRLWEGKPSVTQLLNGTYETFLRITEDYAESPDDMAFRLLGTRSHAGLEDHEVDGALIEYRTEGSDGVGGTFDILETEGGWNVLTDYKYSGAFKVAKALGAYEVYEDHATDVYKQKTTITVDGEKICRLKGESKVIKYTKFDLRRQDCYHLILQLNKYRINLEEEGIKVDEMRIQTVVRDGGLMSATRYGLDRRIYLIPIPFLSDDEVNQFYKHKKEHLMVALDKGDCDTMCSPEENWGGRKCEKFCAVRDKCKFMKNKKLWM